MFRRRTQVFSASFMLLSVLTRSSQPFSLKFYSKSVSTRLHTNRFMSTDAATAQEIAANLHAVQERIQKACAASGAQVRLVAVSKTKPLIALQAAYEAGCRVFGENYAQELVEKIPQMPADCQWHFIGSLQSNKANMLVKAATPVSRLTIETVSSEKLARKLNNAVEDHDGANKLRVFIQVNTSGEDTKSGVTPAEVVDLCKIVATECPKLELRGLMTIGAPGDLSCFETLADCRKQVQEALALETLELSMGMSDDFEEAIAAGATNVRVGSTIFGARDYSAKN